MAEVGGISSSARRYGLGLTGLRRNCPRSAREEEGRYCVVLLPGGGRVQGMKGNGLLALGTTITCSP